MEAKLPEWLEVDHITVFEKMTNLFVSDLAYQLAVDIGPVERFKVLTVDQRRECGVLLVLIDDRVEAEMLLGNSAIWDHIVAELYSALNLGYFTACGICCARDE